MTIIDTHVHLYDLPDPLAVLRQAADGGVTDVVALGVDLASNIKHLELRGRADGSVGIHLALGLHPGNITSREDTAACLRYIRENIGQAVAIGEAGLDFWYKWVRRDEVKKQEQREAFQGQLDLAAEFALPVVIHARGAWRESLEMTRASGIKKAVFHWYSGPLDVLQEILAAGFLVSVSPALEYSPDSRRTAEFVPLDRLLVETDTPVMVNGPDGTRVSSGPKDVWRTFKALCAIKKIAEPEALQTLNTNARAFFNFPVL
ncbi:MAG: TatD family hydrolase [Candidatus Omnitrophica bacterium]|nr:TatD family hydrolase [Candidatus Omnitrophota bacterium]